MELFVAWNVFQSGSNQICSSETYTRATVQNVISGLPSICCLSFVSFLNTKVPLTFTLKSRCCHLPCPSRIRKQSPLGKLSVMCLSTRYDDDTGKLLWGSVSQTCSASYKADASSHPRVVQVAADMKCSFGIIPLDLGPPRIGLWLFVNKEENFLPFPD